MSYSGSHSSDARRHCICCLNRTLLNAFPFAGYAAPTASLGFAVERTLGRLPAAIIADGKGALVYALDPGNAPASSKIYENMEMRLRVQCYAGSKADERPLRFQLGERLYLVEEILDQWYLFLPDFGWTIQFAEERAPSEVLSSRIISGSE